MYVVENGVAVDKGDYFMLTPTEEAGYTNHILYEVTPTKTDRKCPQHDDEDKTTVQVTPFNTPATTLKAGEADAVFWSESAIEKFFFPYYIRHLDKDVFDLMYRTYMSLDTNGTFDATMDRIVAMTHLPSTDWTRVAAIKRLGLTPAMGDRIAPLFSVGLIVGSKLQSLPEYLTANAARRNHLLSIL